MGSPDSTSTAAYLQEALIASRVVAIAWSWLLSPNRITLAFGDDGRQRYIMRSQA